MDSTTPNLKQSEDIWTQTITILKSYVAAFQGKSLIRDRGK